MLTKGEGNPRRARPSSSSMGRRDGLDMEESNFLAYLAVEAGDG
jgi:hypothetical protein